MLRRALYSLILSSLALQANVLSYYQQTLKSLQYNQSYSLYKKATIKHQDAFSQNRYAKFTLSADYAYTDANMLNNSFDTTTLMISDTLDIFNKNGFNIDLLALELQSKKTLLHVQKERLFISLITMLSTYHQSVQKRALHVALLKEQTSIYKKLSRLEKNGTISTIDVLRLAIKKRVKHTSSMQ